MLRLFHTMELVFYDVGMGKVAGPSGTQSVDRTSELVRLVVMADEPPSYTELVATSGLARSTVSRLLGALERGGLVEHAPGGGYRGGPLFAEYADRHDRVQALVDVAHVHLEDLAAETGETVNLAVVRGSEVVHVDQVDARYLVGSVSWLGVSVPPHCSALGKVLLAHGVLRAPSGRLEVRTPHSLTTHAELADELELTRERGHALTRGELEEGLDGVGVPVWGRAGPDGPPVAALGLSGPTFRFGGQRAAYAESLVRHAAAITRDLARAR